MQLRPRTIISYEPFTIPYADLDVRAHVGGKTMPVTPPQVTKVFSGQRIETSSPATDLSSRFGPTMLAPLGHRVHARSGDKGSNANVGFWVSSDDEYEWLRMFLSVHRMKDLLGDEYGPGYAIERFELPNLRCVHFLVKGILQGGVSTGHRVDGLAKSFGEFLRESSREVVVLLVADRRRSETRRYSDKVSAAGEAVATGEMVTLQGMEHWIRWFVMLTRVIYSSSSPGHECMRPGCPPSRLSRADGCLAWRCSLRPWLGLHRHYT